MEEKDAQDAVTYVALGWSLHFSKPLFFHLKNPPKLAGSPKQTCYILSVRRCPQTRWQDCRIKRAGKQE